MIAAPDRHHHHQVALVCVAMVGFVGAFGVGLGPVVWLLPAELFGMEQRAAATALVTAANWLANFAVGQVCPLHPPVRLGRCVV